MTAHTIRSYDQIMHSCDAGITMGIAESDAVIIDGWAIVKTVAVTIQVHKVERGQFTHDA